MRVIQIVASVSNPAYGPSYSVPRLAEAQARAGAEVELHTVGEPDECVAEGVRRIVWPHDLASVPVLAKPRYSRALRRALRQEAMGRADVLHTHGLWTEPNVFPATAAREGGKLFVISPRGMLGAAALKFAGVQKRLFWAAFQRRAVRDAGLIHATGENELDEVRAMGLTNPVALIPNGVDVPDRVTGEAGRERIALSLGRVHPKKGLDRLIRGWALAGAATDGWRLNIVGPSEQGHADELRALAARLRAANVDIGGPVFGDEKLAAYRRADLFILPTLNENFAMTVAESLAAGTPVISTKGAPWSGLESEGCGWWIDHGPEAMAATLKSVLPMPREDLALMGVQGRAWMVREYSWDRVAQRTLAAYRWAIEGGDRPQDVCL